MREAAQLAPIVRQPTRAVKSVLEREFKRKLKDGTYVLIRTVDPCDTQCVSDKCINKLVTENSKITLSVGVN